ncbi:MAG TPA: hypothetical protein VHL10_08065, partial [Nitrososphaera sp.]|nr:hypothetical protein [Nitrososphaera sp.]
MTDEPGYIIRIARDDIEKQLYARRSIYVGIRRDWSRGARILFIRRAGSDDVFIGSGVVDKIVVAGGLAEEERKLCLENNWYGKLAFAKLARFHPVVPIKDTPAAGENPLVLHGAI